jgi:hypothetical protein
MTPQPDANKRDLTPDEYRLLASIVNSFVLLAPHEKPNDSIIYQGDLLDAYREGQSSIMWLLKQQIREAFGITATEQPPSTAGE